MRVLAALGLFVAAALVQGHAAEPLYISDPAQWGHVKRVVEPEFPRRALAEGRSGYVDIRGRVSPVGSLEEVEYSPEDPHAGVFIDPLRRVIRAWEFQPPLGKSCQPSEERVTNRVWFEARDGKPKVSVSLIRPKLPGGPVQIHPLSREEPAYPSSMRRSGVEAVVYTRVQVDAHGDVVSVEPHPYLRRRGANTRDFEHEVIRALTQWKYPPATGAQANRSVCYDVWFKPG